MEKNQLSKPNDALNAGRLLPEVVGFSFFHFEGNDDEVNGFKFDIRFGDDKFSVKFFEGNSEYENQSVKYLVEDEKHADLLKNRHKLIHALQEKVLEQTPQVWSLFSNLKSNKL
ncbi:hypothetical protein [Flavobacterium sp.]|uniref:hypothetical protein n=1 Tax=Flavobacterium sp. TaxID=239 RepID=UPI0026337D99|nr:hypothetical protein [Flavobacterium sp.]